MNLLDHLANRGNTATATAERLRARAETRQERDSHDHKSYQEGAAIAYIDAGKIVEAELRRLCNRFQNGCLSIDDFGIVL